MKVLALVLLLASTVVAADMSQLEKADQLVAHKKYDSALEIYEHVIPKDARVWAAMAYCAMQLHDDVLHTVYALRAGIIAPPALSAGSLSFVHAYALQVAHLVPVLLVQIMLLLLLLLLMYIVINFRFTRRVLLMSLAIACCVVAFIWYLQSSRMDARYVVCKNKVTLHAGPATSYYDVAHCSQAQIVKKVSAHDGWMQVMCGAHTGWIPVQEGIEV